MRYLTEAYYSSAARLKLRQSFGRLGRREKDRGADTRLCNTFLADLLLATTIR